MNQFIYFVLLALVASNIVFLILFIKEKNKSKQRKPDITAQEMLFDLTRGGAILKITVVNPEHLLLRSPRNG